MKRSAAPTIIVLAVLSLAASLFAGAAAAQQKTLKEQLVGTWTFISSTGKLADGSPVWGSNPKGLLIFTDNGRYSSHIVRADVPKFAAKNRLQGTPDENKTAVHGSIASFGTAVISSSRCFGMMSVIELDSPVTLPAGRAKP